MRRIFLAFPVCALVWGQNAQAVLSRMDAAAPAFQNMTARLTRLTFTAVINDTLEEQAVVALARTPKLARFLAEFDKPDVKSVSFGERKFEIYYPKVNLVQEWDLGKNKNLIDQFLLLGFGTSGKDLEKAYAVKYAGEDSVLGGKCSRLELAPRSKQVKDLFSRIELCIAENAGHPLRQKLVEANGNYTLFHYSNVRINPGLRPDQLSLKTPPNVKREYPQK